MPATPSPNRNEEGKLSQSEERAVKAALWVEKEVDKLLVEIEKMGRTNGAKREVTFGELFRHYQDISDTLVGILARAKKRELLTYQGHGGEMLLQGRHDNVIITVDVPKADNWRKAYHSGTLPPPTTPSPASARQSPPAQQVSPAGASVNLKRLFSQEASPPPAPKPAATPMQSVKASPALSASPMVATARPLPPLDTTPPATTSPATNFILGLVEKVRSSAPPTPKTEEPNPLEKKPAPVSLDTASEQPGFIQNMMNKILPLSPRSEAASATTTAKPAAETLGEMPVLEPSALERAREAMTGMAHKLAGALSPPATPRASSPPPTGFAGLRKVAEPAPAATPSQPSPPRMLHAAHPQRTRDGTRGAVVHSRSPPQTMSKSPLAAIAAQSGASHPTYPSSGSAPQHKSAPAPSKAQAEWTAKHLSRGVVTSSASPSGAPVVRPGSVAAKSAAFGGTKTGGATKSSVPTGLQAKRFAWE